MLRFGVARRAAVVGVSVLLVGFGALGCGDDNSSDGGSKASQPARFKGEPVVVHVTSTVGVPIQDIPQVFSGVKAAARAMNEAGGIQGHEVKVATCNGRGDPNQELQCARDAVRQKAIAEVGSFPLANIAGFEEILDKNDIVDIGAIGTSPVQYTSPNTFQIDFNNGAFSICASPAFAEIAGGNRLATAAVDIAVTKVIVEGFIGASKNQGATYVGGVRTPVTAIDFSPFVEQLDNFNPNIVGLAMDQNGAGNLMNTAIGTGKKRSFCSNDGVLALSTLAKLGPRLETYYSGSTYPPISASDQFPYLQEFKDQMAAQEESGDENAGLDVEHYNQNALKAWMGMQAVKAVADTIDGPITAKSFRDAISKAEAVDLGLEKPIDFTKPFGAPPYPRIFRDTIYLQKWNPQEQEYELVEDTTVSGVEAVLGKSTSG